MFLLFIFFIPHILVFVDNTEIRSRLVLCVVEHFMTIWFTVVVVEQTKTRKFFRFPSNVCFEFQRVSSERNDDCCEISEA